MCDEHEYESLIEGYQDAVQHESNPLFVADRLLQRLAPILFHFML
jgi:hypothetical protein